MESPNSKLIHRHRVRFLVNTAYYATVAALLYLAYHYLLPWVLPFLLAFCIVSLVHPVGDFLKKS